MSHCDSEAKKNAWSVVCVGFFSLRSFLFYIAHMYVRTRSLTHTRAPSQPLSALCMGAAIIESDSGNLVQFVLNLPLMMSSAAERKSCGYGNQGVCVHVCTLPCPTSLLDLSVLLCISIFYLSLCSVCVCVCVCLCVCLAPQEEACKSHTNTCTQMEIYQALYTSGGSWGQKPSIHPFTSSSAKYLFHHLLLLHPPPPPSPPYSICKL